MKRIDQSVPRTVANLVLALLVTMMAGCSSMSGVKDVFSNLDNPFSNEVPAYKSQYGPTPAQKANRLRQLAQSASTLQAEEQTRISTELYDLYSKTSDPILRREAVRAMGSFGVPIAAAGLQAASEDAEAAVRIAACDAWTRRRGPEAVAALSSLLKSDADVDVRLAASAALATFPPDVATKHLGAVLEDRDPAVQFAAMDALRTSTGLDVGNDVNLWARQIQGMTTPAVNSGVSEQMIASPINSSTDSIYR